MGRLCLPLEDLECFNLQYKLLRSVFPAPKAPTNISMQVVGDAFNVILLKYEKRMMEEKLVPVLNSINRQARRLTCASDETNTMHECLNVLLDMILKQKMRSPVLRDQFMESRIYRSICCLPISTLPSTPVFTRLLEQYSISLANKPLSGINCEEEMSCLYRIIKRAHFVGKECQGDGLFRRVCPRVIFEGVVKRMKTFSSSLSIQQFGSGVLSFLPDFPGKVKLAITYGLSSHLLDVMVASMSLSVQHFCLAALKSIFALDNGQYLHRFQDQHKLSMLHIIVSSLKLTLECKRAVLLCMLTLKYFGEELVSVGSPTQRNECFNIYVGAMCVQKQSWRVQAVGWETFVIIFGRQTMFEQQYQYTSLIPYWLDIMELHGAKHPSVISSVLYALGTYLVTPIPREYTLRQSLAANIEHLVEQTLTRRTSVQTSVCFFMWSVMACSVNPMVVPLQSQAFQDVQNHSAVETIICRSNIWRNVLEAVVRVMETTGAGTDALHCVSVTIAACHDRVEYFESHFGSFPLTLFRKKQLQLIAECYTKDGIKVLNDFHFWVCAAVKAVCSAGSSDAFRLKCYREDCHRVCITALQLSSKTAVTGEALLALERLFRSNEVVCLEAKTSTREQVGKTIAKLTNGIQRFLGAGYTLEIRNSECVEAYCKLILRFTKLLGVGKDSVAIYEKNGVLTTLITLLKTRRTCIVSVDAILCALKELVSIRGIGDVCMQNGLISAIQTVMTLHAESSASTAALGCGCFGAVLENVCMEKTTGTAWWKRLLCQVHGALCNHVHSAFVQCESIRTLANIATLDTSPYIAGKEYVTVIKVMKDNVDNSDLQLHCCRFFTVLVNLETTIVKRLLAHNLMFIVLRALNVHIADTNVALKLLQLLNGMLSFPHHDAGALNNVKSKHEFRALLVAYRLSTPTLATKVFLRFRGMELLLKAARHFKGTCDEFLITEQILHSWKNVLLFHQVDVEERDIIDVVASLVEMSNGRLLMPALWVLAYINLHYEDNDLPLNIRALIETSLEKIGRDRARGAFCNRYHFLLSY